MKRVRPETWVCQLQPPRNPRLLQRCNFSHDTRQSAAFKRIDHDRSRLPCQWPQSTLLVFRRHASSGAAVAQEEEAEITPDVEQNHNQRSIQKRSPKKREIRNHRIAKLSALHARLALPASLPLNTLARCLIDETADPHAARNNASLAVLGRDLLAYYTTEHLMVHYPRLPMSILYAAQYAYSGVATLSAIRTEWGVELAAAPGPEVDRALLQFQRIVPGNALAADGVSRVKDAVLGEKQERVGRQNFSKTMNRDEFGGARSARTTSRTLSELQVVEESDPETRSAQDAGATFIRAVVGAVYLHAGEAAAKAFHSDHILSRHLQLHKLFNFKAPLQDVNRLCHREGFEPPVARLISETGRLSRSPVFVVGIFSGDDKLGEGAGASLNEGRVRAAAAAMRSWYLYSPPIDRIMRPSEVDSAGKNRNEDPWLPQMIDIGEVVT